LRHVQHAALCLPVGLTDTDLAQLDAVLGNRIKIKKAMPSFATVPTSRRCMRSGSVR
jgi:hypothetical protein